MIVMIALASTVGNPKFFQVNCGHVWCFRQWWNVLSVTGQMDGAVEVRTQNICCVNDWAPFPQCERTAGQADAADGSKCVAESGLIRKGPQSIYCIAGLCLLGANGNLWAVTI